MENTWMIMWVKVNALFISATEKENFEEFREKVYEAVREIHVTRFPYNKFLYPDYKDAVEELAQTATGVEVESFFDFFCTNARARKRPTEAPAAGAVVEKNQKTWNEKPDRSPKKNSEKRKISYFIFNYEIPRSSE
jgi:arginine utilization protein RocB